MEAYILVMTLAFSLILTLLAFMGSRAGWTFLSFLGSGIAGLCALVLSSDGNLTWLGTTLAAANGNDISDFNVVAWTSIVVAIGEMVIGIRRVAKI